MKPATVEHNGQRYLVLQAFASNEFANVDACVVPVTPEAIAEWERHRDTFNAIKAITADINYYAVTDDSAEWVPWDSEGLDPLDTDGGEEIYPPVWVDAMVRIELPRLIISADGIGFEACVKNTSDRLDSFVSWDDLAKL